MSQIERDRADMRHVMRQRDCDKAANGCACGFIVLFVAIVGWLMGGY